MVPIDQKLWFPFMQAICNLNCTYQHKIRKVQLEPKQLDQSPFCQLQLKEIFQGETCEILKICTCIWCEICFYRKLIDFSSNKSVLPWIKNWWKHKCAHHPKSSNLRHIKLFLFCLAKFGKNAKFEMKLKCEKALMISLFKKNLTS